MNNINQHFLISNYKKGVTMLKLVQLQVVH